MPIEQSIKERAYAIDPSCWISYTGKPPEFKAAMDARRTLALETAAAEQGKKLPEFYVVHGVEITNKHICPDDEISVIVTAEKIPSGSTVTKRTGDARYVLVRNLTVYREKGAAPLVIEGYFLLGDRGSINQVTPGKRLACVTNADDFVYALKDSWEQELK